MKRRVGEWISNLQKGAGGAGFLAAQTIRQDGFKGRVVLVTKEVY